MDRQGETESPEVDEDGEKAVIAMDVIRLAIATYRDVLKKVEEAISAPGKIKAFAELAPVMEQANASVLECDLDAMRRIVGPDVVASLMGTIERQSQAIGKLMRLHGYAGAIH